MKNYIFDGIIEKEVLENYLSKAVTAANLINSKTLKDDLRVIQNLEIKFIGRAANAWKLEKDEEGHFEKCCMLAKAVHGIDSDIILQACIFEAVYQEIAALVIPEYVFHAFGMKPEKRNFRWEDMLFLEKPEGYIWGKEGGIPDLCRIEAQLWFYYRSRRYIDAGFEALHMGQIHLYTANDRGFQKTKELFEKIREYGKKAARRHKVILDAHTHGINIKGELLLDYHAMPYTRVPLLERAGEDLVFVREGFSEGGVNPNGWSADAMPYLMEYDNWGGLVVPHRDQYKRAELAWLDWWGYDQIGWFANQKEEYRNHFLEYTYKWTQINNRSAFFLVPFRRGLELAAVKMKREDTGIEEIQDYYQLNTRSVECPDGGGCPLGFGQEEKIKEIWENSVQLRNLAANPEHIEEYGGREEYDPETGLKVPERVILYGSFQPYVGAVKNDSNSEVTRMYYRGDNTYTLSILMPYAGEYDFAVSTYGTLSATYGMDRFPRSGSSNKSYFKTKKENTVVAFTYRFIDQVVRLDFYD